MKKVLAAVCILLMVCVGVVLTACTVPETPPEEPLTVTDCFKDFVPCLHYKFSYRPEGYENKPNNGENVSLAELMKVENDIAMMQYSDFQIFTTKQAAKIEVTSISFDFVTTKSNIVQFCLQTALGITTYSNSAVAQPGTPTTITFSGLHKRWTSEDAGNSEMKYKRMLGEASTYLLIELINKSDFLEEGYRIQNLQISFEEIK